MLVKKKAKKRLYKILSTSIYLCSILVITLLLVTFVVQKTVVVGESMENTLTDGDQLLTDKLSYSIGNPKRFDIIAFKYSGKAYFVKRIIGLPGESVRIDEEGTIYINEEPLKEHYGNAVIEEPGLAVRAVTCGPDEYFVLGDNRNNSIDSRSADVWLVSRNKILGKPLIRIYPFNKMGIVK